MTDMTIGDGVLPRAQLAHMRCEHACVMCMCRSSHVVLDMIRIIQTGSGRHPVVHMCMCMACAWCCSVPFMRGCNVTARTQHMHRCSRTRVLTCSDACLVVSHTLMYIPDTLPSCTRDVACHALQLLGHMYLPYLTYIHSIHTVDMMCRVPTHHWLCARTIAMCIRFSLHHVSSSPRIVR